MPEHEPAAAQSRIAAARRRAHVAKLGMGAAALACFGLGMTLVKANVAGHSRHALRPLDAPPRFQAIVRHDALDRGLLAPAQAAPSATTAQS
ncbi:MAG TPA: hypothetical protein VGL44_17525 [Gaiellales bacterium]|jgi:hypothetical protein